MPPRPSNNDQLQQVNLRAHEILDEQLYAKILFAINSHFQIWLKKGEMLEICIEVDGTHRLANLIRMLPHNLPPTFKMKGPVVVTATTAAASASKKKDGSGNEEGKHKKKKKDEDGAMVKNEAPHPELCILSTETWAINFVSKHNNKRPKWNETCHCCPRWFLQKYCFSDCKNKDSHMKVKNPHGEFDPHESLDQDMPIRIMSGPSGVRPPPKPIDPDPPKPRPIALESALTIHHSIPLLPTKDTPVLPSRPAGKDTSVLPPRPIVRFGLPSKAMMDIGIAAVLREYLL